MSIAEAGRELDIAPDTLRKWQHRYGLGPSRRSPGGHRRYIRADLLRLRRVRDLIARGVPTADAARQVLQSEAIGLEPISADPAAHRLAAAAAQLDGPSVRHLLDHELARRGVVDTWEQLLRPVLVAAGARAQHSAHGIAMEHVLSHVIQAAFATAPTRNPSDPPAPAPSGAMLACAPGEEHELPLVALAAALAEYGIPTTCSAPELHLAPSLRQPASTAACLSCSRCFPHPTPECLQNPPPHARIIAAGPGWDPVALPPQLTHTNSLPEAVTLLHNAAPR